MRVILTIGVQGLAVAVALGDPAAALAARPMATDDAGTLGRGGLQLELGAALRGDVAGPAGARARERTGEAGLAFGAGLRDDLDVVLGISVTRAEVRAGGERTTTRGVGDAAVDVKWRALEASGFSLALKPGVTLPTGDAREGLGTGRVCYALTLIASQELGWLAVHANAAYLRDEHGRSEDRAASRADRLRASMAATARVAESLLLVADVGAETNPDRASSTWPAYALGGLIYSAGEDLDLDLGVKAGLTAPEIDLAGTLGVTWRF